MTGDLHMEKLDAILAGQAATNARLDKIEAALGTAPAPAPTGGLYDFVRPDPVEPRYGLGVEMTSPDVAEAKKRAMSCVDWRGGQTRSTDEDSTWAEVQKLQGGRPSDIEPYRMLNPEFAGYALLVGLIDPVSRDGPSFGKNREKRESLSGATIQSFLDDQLRVTGTPGVAGE